jgi:hypothetical protein
MKTRVIVLATALVFGASALANAQTAPAPVKKIQIRGENIAAPASTGAQPASGAVQSPSTTIHALGTAQPPSGTAPPTLGTAKAEFNCNARAPNVCHFRIYYSRYSRNVVLPAGMMGTVRQLRLGSDTYCVSINTRPIPKCVRRSIAAKNSA